jgi:hypothetical protein
MRRFVWCAALTVMLGGMQVFAADANKADVYTDAAAAGADFQTQGEYEGSIGEKQKIGVQVVALGDGKFDAVVYQGGLPGAGWTGKTKIKLTGETKDGVTTLSGQNFSGELKAGEFSGKAEEGVPFTAKKVERKSPTLGAKAPEGAIVLFDGKNVDAWDGVKLVEDKYLGVGGQTKQKFTDFTLHLEFRTPFMPKARGQGRGNSGMYLLHQYECQVLDSFGLNGENNECGGIYQIAKPAVNMCLPPLSWQTYDVEFTAAKFDAQGKKIADCETTIRHNGVVIHDKLKFPKATPGGAKTDEVPPGSLFLQNHGDPVVYQNIWIVEKK